MRSFSVTYMPWAFYLILSHFAYKGLAAYARSCYLSYMYLCWGLELETVFHVSISHLRVGGVSIQCQYQQKEVYPNQVCMGNDCMQVCICIPCHSCSERYSDPKLCILSFVIKYQI